MNIDEICKYIDKTNDIKVINRILKKINYYQIPYYYIDKLNNILVLKENNLIQKIPNNKAIIPYFLSLMLFLVTNPSSKLIVLLLEIITSLMVRKLSISCFPKLFTDDAEASELNIDEYEMQLQEIKEALNFKQKNNSVDYMLTKDSNSIVNEKIFNDKIKNININEKDIEYNENLMNELNKCLEYEGIQAFNYFEQIVNNVKRINSLTIQNYAFNILPKYFLLLCEKNKNINPTQILSSFDTYFITILVKYLCDQEDYIPFKKEYLLNEPSYFRILTEALVESHLEDYERSRKKDV